MKLPLQKSCEVFLVGSKWGDTFKLNEFIDNGYWENGYGTDINVHKGSLLISYDYDSDELRVAIASSDSQGPSVSVNWYANSEKNLRDYPGYPLQQTFLCITENGWFKKEIKNFIENNNSWQPLGASHL